MKNKIVFTDGNEYPPVDMFGRLIVCVCDKCEDKYTRLEDLVKRGIKVKIEIN